MDSDYGSEDPDFTPAMPLEISAELAAEIDGLLRQFAEDAELDMALVVEQSGALVTGISSEVEIKVEVISALVAGATGAMRALVGELGESGDLETFHQGDDRVIYLSELVKSFVLVGVCTAPTPVAILREKANQIRAELEGLLLPIEVPDPVEEQPKPLSVSLRAVALERAAAREVEEAKRNPEPEEEMEPEEPSDDSVDATEEIEGEMSEAEDEPDSEEEVAEPEAEEEPEPVEVREVIGSDEPEIVIEDSGRGVVDSPFEMEEEDVEEEVELESSGPQEAADSVFELEEDPEEEVENVFEIDEDEEAADEDEGPEQDAPTDTAEPVSHHSDPSEVSEGNIFEIDKEEEADFELDDEEEEAAQEETAEEEDDSEVRSSGPFYF